MSDCAGSNRNRPGSLAVRVGSCRVFFRIMRFRVIRVDDTRPRTVGHPARADTKRKATFTLRMWGFRGGVALDLVDLGWFQAPRGGCDRYSGRFDIHSTLICLAAVRLDTISMIF